METESNISHDNDISSELNQLKRKESKLKRKIQELKQELDLIKTQNTVLIEENKLLKETRAPVKHLEHKVDMSSQIASVFSGIDTIISNQNTEITELIQARDSLSAQCFNSLTVIRRQQFYMEKMKSTMNKLINFIGQQGESIQTVDRELSQLGIDAHSQLENMQRKYIIKDLASTVPLSAIDTKDALEAVNALVSSNQDRSCLEVVVNFVQSNAGLRDDLQERLKKATAKIETQSNVITEIFSSLGARTFKGAIKSISSLINKAIVGKEMEKRLEAMIDALEQVRSKCKDDINVKCSIGRLRRWLEEGYAGMDVAKEIEFLTGLCYPNENSAN